ncbi:uncharacterized protein CMU_029160 [Cryptosporidium muris RN66]|uniref:Uncharacterized protein n=1 Tax=Cryptosporidium muris (strain RN66) TaxID=441375 RepID=B6AI01_CRYMR|nr:uncharacterized protein CMU_029160 [Cryptosporidium muris RN66]EEA07842.1 hypothetical protein CMU_029160 [Cryptosporidium muris RN66]|eukprot:XP_002142191.1 hypothetical protein [Cryptosporidium muris RN66]
MRITLGTQEFILSLILCILLALGSEVLSSSSEDSVLAITASSLDQPTYAVTEPHKVVPKQENVIYLIPRGFIKDEKVVSLDNLNAEEYVVASQAPNIEYVVASQTPNIEYFVASQTPNIEYVDTNETDNEPKYSYDIVQLYPQQSPVILRSPVSPSIYPGNVNNIMQLTDYPINFNNMIDCKFYRENPGFCVPMSIFTPCSRCKTTVRTFIRANYKIHCPGSDSFPPQLRPYFIWVPTSYRNQRRERNWWNRRWRRQFMCMVMAVSDIPEDLTNFWQYSQVSQESGDLSVPMLLSPFTEQFVNFPLQGASNSQLYYPQNRQTPLSAGYQSLPKYYYKSDQAPSYETITTNADNTNEVYYIIAN